MTKSNPIYTCALGVTNLMVWPKEPKIPCGLPKANGKVHEKHQFERDALIVFNTNLVGNETRCDNSIHGWSKIDPEKFVGLLIISVKGILWAEAMKSQETDDVLSRNIYCCLMWQGELKMTAAQKVKSHPQSLS